MIVNCKIPFCCALVLICGLSASNAQSEPNSPPQALTNIWARINYPLPKSQEDRMQDPIFSITSGEQWGQVSRGLRLDIMNIAQGFGFFKTNAIEARLYRANGTIVEPTADGKELLNAPVSLSTFSIPRQMPAPQTMTYFPWGTNALEQCWIEVTIGSERYWLEIPYGFDQNPTATLLVAGPGGPPQFVPAMKTLTEHDHVERWQNVVYELGENQNGWRLSLKQANPFDAQTVVLLNRHAELTNGSPLTLFSPRTAVRILESDGKLINGRCINLHCDNGWSRTDTFDIYDRGANDTRCWGRIEVKVGDKSFSVAVPSSLYKYGHGHADKPTAIAYLAALRVGMTLAEADALSRNYLPNGTRRHSVSSAAQHEYRYEFPHHTGEVTLRFDESDHLTSWKGR